MEQEKIDFVVTWVDGDDPVWRARKEEFLKKEYGISPERTDVEDGDDRYRDFGVFQYWFRSVEKFAPWVNKIFLVTDRQKPDWLDEKHPKICWVNHDEFIPNQYLPTYSSPAIEWNFHRIEELSENFVYFNDDMYLTAPVKPEDFFVNGHPKLVAVYDAIVPWHPFLKTIYNNVEVIHRHFPKKDALRRSPFKFLNVKYGLKGILKNLCLLPWQQTGYVDLHVAMPLKKSTLYKLWDLEAETIEKTVSYPLRDYNTGTNPYLLSYWQIESNEFQPQSIKIGKRIDANQVDELEAYLKTQKFKIICVNDTTEFDPKNQERLLTVFNEVFPEKSEFER